MSIYLTYKIKISSLFLISTPKFDRRQSFPFLLLSCGVRVITIYSSRTEHERAFIPSLLFFFSFLSAHLVALSYSSRPVHARACCCCCCCCVCVFVWCAKYFTDCCGALGCFCFYEGGGGGGGGGPKKGHKVFRRRESKIYYGLCQFCVLSFLSLSTCSKEGDIVDGHIYI